MQLNVSKTLSQMGVRPAPVFETEMNGRTSDELIFETYGNFVVFAP